MKNQTIMHTKDDLTPVLLKTFECVKKKLPSAVGGRLKSSRQVRNHPSDRGHTWCFFNVWDVNQGDTLPSDYFCYCIGYYGSDDCRMKQQADTSWYLHLWIDPKRLGCSQRAVKQIRGDVEKACPKGFKFKLYPNGRFEVKMSFEFDGSLARLPDFLVPLYVRLISAIHPAVSY